MQYKLANDQSIIVIQGGWVMRNNNYLSKEEQFREILNNEETNSSIYSSIYFVFTGLYFY